MNNIRLLLKKLKTRVIEGSSQRDIRIIVILVVILLLVIMLSPLLSTRETVFKKTDNYEITYSNLTQKYIVELGDTNDPQKTIEEIRTTLLEEMSEDELETRVIWDIPGGLLGKELVEVPSEEVQQKAIDKFIQGKKDFSEGTHYSE